MSLALLLAAALCVVNPARVRPALPERDTVPVGALGAALTWAALVPVVALADTALEALQVAASTLRMAVGIVLVLQGAWTLVSRPPSPEPALPGRRAALVPVAFPVLVTPGLALVALSGALDRSAPTTLAVAAGALAMVPLAGAIRPSPVRGKALEGLARLTAAALVAVGVALVVNGLYDI